MICKYCNGTGTSNICVNGTFKPCSACNGTGIEEEPQEQTNEEWFTSLSTEEKAKFIFWQHFDIYGKTLYELMVNASKGVSRDKQAEVMIGAVVEWLKEKHDG